MRPAVLRFAALVIVTLASFAPASAQDTTERWAKLTIADIPAGSTTFTIDVHDKPGRARGLRLRTVGGPLALTMVTVTYSNGQVFYDQRELTLEPDRNGPAIDRRDEARFVDSVTIEFQARSRAKQVELWALYDPREAADERSQTVARPTARTTRGFTTMRREDDTTTRSAASSTDGYVEIPVFFGTDRRREADRTKHGRTLASFGPRGNDQLTLGKAVVTVPTEGRDAGELNRPEWNLIVTRIALRGEDPKRDFTILDVTPLDERAFLELVEEHRSGGQTFKDHALVFVHGYYVSFDDALFRAAQIARDLKFDGVPFVYSWPSQAGLLGYVYDRNRARGAREYLRRFLQLIAERTGVKQIHLIGHSMGAEPLLEALRDYALSGVTQKLFNQVILAAPDITRDNFRLIARSISPIADGITLYASSKDRALQVSSSLAEAPAGYVTRDGPILVQGVDSIDVSAASTGFFSLNHSTFADREPLLTDLGLLLKTGVRPPVVRWPAKFVEIRDSQLPYWLFNK